MDQIDIARQRLHNQRLSGVKLGTPEEVVGWLGAVQAQDYAGAKWSLGQRMAAATDALLDQAFNAGSILRTHLLRPTWHFVTPADIHWLLALTAPRVHAANAHMYRQVGLDGAIIQGSQAALAKALQGGIYLTRTELSQALERAGIETGVELRLAYILMHAELEGLICSGPRRGAQFTYAKLDERAPQFRSLSHDAALVELARRYFLSRGPATLHDFAKWSGLTITDARLGLEAVKDDLVPTTVNGQQYWQPEAAPIAKEPSPFVHLLSIYDEVISGYKDRSAFGEAEHGSRLMEMGNALRYLILVNGQIVGTWRRQIKKSAVIIETSLFNALSASEEHALATAFQRYGQFLELQEIIT